jgi:branched-chain amino acid transport system ATP-binding protein
MRGLVNNEVQSPDLATYLTVNNIDVNFGGLKALENVSLGIEKGKITALIGPNGAGKSTLLNVISGFQVPSTGNVAFKNQSITNRPAYARTAMGMARTFQDLEVQPTLTVLENTILGIQKPKGENLYHLLTSPRSVRLQNLENINRTLEILQIVGLEDQADVLAGNLSFGDQKLLSIARLLATDADLLMLDEPGAGLSSAMVNQLGNILKRMVDRDKTILFVDHNMNLVMNFAEWIVVLHHGKVIAKGTPDEIRNHPEVIRVYLTG